MPPSRAVPRGSPKLLAKLGLSACLLLLAAEGGMRLRQKVKYGTFGQIYEFATDEKTGLPTPVPGRQTEHITINSLGFRGPELEPPSDEVLRIAFLGASTTFCAEVSSDAATWPSLVTQGLSERFAPQRFDHVNAGVAGYSLAESAKNLEFRVGPLEPDVIVIYHATNDLTRNSRVLAQEQGIYQGHADQQSWLGGYSLAWYLVEKNLLLRRRTQAAREGAGRLEVDLVRLQAPFRRDLEQLVELARSRARRVCLVTFAHRARPGQSTEELFEACVTSLYYMPYMTPQGLLESFEAYNQVIREVALASGSLLVEGAQAVPGDRVHFRDSVHLTDAGARALAEAVLQALSADETFRGLRPD